MNEHIALAIRGLEMMRGDDLARARNAFRGLPPEKMAEPYGQGLTRMEILRDYEEHDARITAAIAHLRGLR